MRPFARLFIGALCAAGLAAAAPAAAKWTAYENCRWIEHASNDGDSFHVQCGRTRRIYRLYFVDAPETDNRFPERLREQAEYFGIGIPATRSAGDAAASLVRRFLARGFTVYTRREDALGSSQQPRYFALVRVDDTWLCEELVRHGLARIHGMPADLPDGTPARKHIANLKVLERTARRNKAGAWKTRR